MTELHQAVHGPTCALCREHLGTGGVILAPIVNRIARNATPQVSVECTRCGLVQAVPMPSAETLTTYYGSGQYRREFPPLPVDGVPPDAPEYEQACTAQAEQAAAWLVQHLGLTPGMRVHEVGAGYGRVVDALSELVPTPDISWDEGGTDVRITAWDADPAMRAKWWPPRGRTAPGPAVFERPRDRDVVYALQVLEHTPDPVATLAEWRAMLRDDGHVHVQVPTLEAMYGGAEHFFQWPHVVNFTRRTLALTMLRAGLLPTRIAINGNILHATGRKQEPWPFERCEQAVENMPRVPAAELIAQHEATRPKARWPLIDEWLAGGGFARYVDGRVEEEAALQAQVREMRDALDCAHDTIRALAENLHTEAERLSNGIGEHAAGSFFHTMACGEIMATKTTAQAVTAVANGLVRR